MAVARHRPDTDGQALAAELRRYFRISTRTRRYRKSPVGGRDDLHSRMIEEIEAVCVHGPAFPRAMALKPGWGAVLSYQKHYLDYRMDPLLRRHIELMSPWRFSALLGEMVDAGVTNVGQGERFFREMGRQPAAAGTLAAGMTATNTPGIGSGLAPPHQTARGSRCITRSRPYRPHLFDQNSFASNFASGDNYTSVGQALIADA